MAATLESAELTAAMVKLGVFADDVELALEMDAALLSSFRADASPAELERFRERVLSAAYGSPSNVGAAAFTPSAAAGAPSAAPPAPPAAAAAAAAVDDPRERALAMMEAAMMASALASGGAAEILSAAELQSAMDVVLSGGELSEEHAAAAEAAAEQLVASGASRSFVFEATVPPVVGASDAAGRAVRVALETSEDDELEGSIVWDTSIVLARLLLDEEKYPRRFFARPRRFLELGSGCGLLGIAAALRGASVTLTDIASVLPRLRRNVDANRDLLPSEVELVADVTPAAAHADEAERLAVAELDWTRLDDALSGSAVRPPYDVILVADCVYQEALVEPLIDVLAALSGPKTVILLGLRSRFRFQADFLAQLHLWFSGSALRPDARHLVDIGRSDDLIFLRLKKRPDDED